jgi:hypothetical protein
MNRRTKLAMGMAFLLGVNVLGALAARADTTAYYVGTLCNPQTQWEPFWFHEATNITNGSGVTNNVRCGLPNDNAFTNVQFQFTIKRNGTGTSTCNGFIVDPHGNVTWTSNTTTHNSQDANGLSTVSTNNGPAGNDGLTYTSYCNLASSHKLERIALM